MAHMRRNAKFQIRRKKANHGRLGSLGVEKSQFDRYRRRKDRKPTTLV